MDSTGFVSQLLDGIVRDHRTLVASSALETDSAICGAKLGALSALLKSWDCFESVHTTHTSCLARVKSNSTLDAAVRLLNVLRSARKGNRDTVVSTSEESRRARLSPDYLMGELKARGLQAVTACTLGQQFRWAVCVQDPVSANVSRNTIVLTNQLGDYLLLRLSRVPTNLSDEISVNAKQTATAEVLKECRAWKSARSNSGVVLGAVFCAGDVLDMLLVDQPGLPVILEALHIVSINQAVDVHQDTKPHQQHGLRHRKVPAFNVDEPARGEHSKWHDASMEGQVDVVDRWRQVAMVVVTGLLVAAFVVFGRGRR